jgi:hypothetical protein
MLHVFQESCAILRHASTGPLRVYENSVPEQDRRLRHCSVEFGAARAAEHCNDRQRD